MTSPTFCAEKLCTDCGEPFLPTGGNQRYCTSCTSTHETPQMQLRRKLDRIADVAADAGKMTPAMLRMRIQAVYEGCDMPTEQDPFLKLGVRAGVSYKLRNEAWRQVASGLPGPLTADRLATALTEARSLEMPRPQQSTALYRWWDEADALLYIGISGGLLDRVSDHAGGSSWMEFAARSTIARYATRTEALEAEEAAIKAERPLFNHIHNATPEAKLRLVEYLIEQGRPDLLAPVISRG